MPVVSGALRLVTDRPADVTEVWVRSGEVRPYSGGIVTDFSDTVQVANGQVSFTCLPGAAGLVLVQAGVPQVMVPIIVQGSPAQQSLEDVVRAAQYAQGHDADALAAAVRQITSSLTSSEKVAAKVAQDASNAASSASAAKGHADRAGAARTGAESAQTGARNAESSAKTQASNAASSASAAATSERNAKTSETNAAASAKTAKDEADRAATIAGSTKWEGTRLRVNNQLSPDLKGPKGDKGDRGTDGTVTFESLTPAQLDQIRGKPGVVAQPDDPGRMDVVWIDTDADPQWYAVANSVTVETEEQAAALSGKVPVGTFVRVLETGNEYREEA